MPDKSTRERIIAALEASSDALSPEALATVLRVPIKRIYKALARMRRDGAAHRSAWDGWQGLWSPGPGPDAIAGPAAAKRYAGIEAARQRRADAKHLAWLSVDHRTALERALCPCPGSLPITRYLPVAMGA